MKLNSRKVGVLNKIWHLQKPKHILSEKKALSASGFSVGRVSDVSQVNFHMQITYFSFSATFIVGKHVRKNARFGLVRKWPCLLLLY